MRINRIEISNFRAITKLSISDLKDTVVIAGPNGCGKSCVFDAIRLLKSVYGGYQPNEWHSWFGEFQINVNRPDADFLPLFQDQSKNLELSAQFELAISEQIYLRQSVERILTDEAWRELDIEQSGFIHKTATSLAANLRLRDPKVQENVKERLPELLHGLDNLCHDAQLIITPNGNARIAPSRVLEILFGNYDPNNVGIIDYHGSNRNYNREKVNTINLNIDSSHSKLRQHALYNYSQKYSNIKSEMASDYIQGIIAEEAGQSTNASNNLVETLKELFSTFFEGKEFIGPCPTADGRILFPVKTSNRSRHDIDDLSSGEKEILYGYLRLRRSAPKNSVLLIDEPELHLNPRLISGLASFYHRHLGTSLGTQLWLVTHSDTLIREAVAQDGFSVFHLQPASQYDGKNQASIVQANADLDRLVIELVGDLAAYRPGAKIVIFEGESDTCFDINMACSLFPALQAKTNAISGRNKRRVNQLYDLLESLRDEDILPLRFYAITDADDESLASPNVSSRLQWDRYHIENYLLEPHFILRVLDEINRNENVLRTEGEVFNALRECASRTIDNLVAHKLRKESNRSLVSCIDLNFDPARSDVAEALLEAIERSLSKITDFYRGMCDVDGLEENEQSFRKILVNDIDGDTWTHTFRGRDILKIFAAKYCKGIRYEQFRNLILARMRDEQYQPEGMKGVIDKILEHE